MLGLDARAARVTWTVALVLLALSCVYFIRLALFILVIALLFAYLLYPLMSFISRRFSAKTRTLALALTFLVVIIILGTLLSFVGAVVVDQASNLVKTAPAFINRIQQQAPQAPRPVQTLQEQVGSFLEGQVRAHYDEIVGFMPQLGLRVLSASGNLIYLVIIPILSFIMLRDGATLRDGFLSTLRNQRAVAKANDVLDDVHNVLLHYMRALLLLCCNTFLVFTIVLSLMRVPYPILLATIAFPLEFIPLVGPMIAAAVVIAVAVAGGYGHLLWLVLFLGTYRLFQDYVLWPALMSRGTELHPLMVIFGVFAGGELAGVPGVFLSVPVLALLQMFYRRFRARA